VAGTSMEVDPTHLYAGADRCVDAAGTALAAAGKLAAEKSTAGLFGDFAEAHAFHEAVSAAHHDHVERLHGQHRALTDISDKGRWAADEFTARDVSSADSLRVAEAGFGTL
jgi:hypothetical protein